MTSFVKFLVSWGPMVLLIGVWIYLMRRSGTLRYSQYVDEMRKLAQDQLDEMRATNQRLAQIEELLRAQTSATRVDAGTR